MNTVIGVVGMGFVGKGCIEGFKGTHQVETQDINFALNPTCKTIGELVSKADVIFVAVPTPTSKNNGSCNISILERVVHEIDVEAGQQGKKGVVVVCKSTIPPGTTMGLQLQSHNISICFNPEFLTEANWLTDFLNQEHVILGYPPKSLIGEERFAAFKKVETAYNKALPSARLIITLPQEAEFVKYARNCMLALKVSFANELETIAYKLGIKWDDIFDAITADPRVGRSHMRVPGPDGHRGFGGTCFPKDIQALIYFAKEIGAEVPVAEAAWERNHDIDRPERDWEELKGRSVTE